MHRASAFFALMFVVACAALTACVVQAGSSRSSGTSSGSTSSGGPDEALTDDENDTATRGNSGVSPVQLAAQVADSVFDFDPTIDPTKTAAENAEAIRANIIANLGGDVVAGPKCGSVSLAQPATVTIDFGPPPGCTLVKKLTVSGAVVAGVTQSGSTITVSLAFSALVVNDVDLDGQVSFSTSTGTSFVTSGKLTSGGRTLTLNALTITGAAGSMIVGGGVTLSGPAGTTALTFKQVTWKIGACYPDGGSLTARKGLVAITLPARRSLAPRGA